MCAHCLPFVQFKVQVSITAHGQCTLPILCIFLGISEEGGEMVWTHLNDSSSSWCEERAEEGDQCQSKGGIVGETREERL